MANIIRLDHVAIVVEDLENPLNFWQNALGLELDRTVDVPEQKSVVAFLRVGESEVELVKPMTADTGIGRYLQKHGPGIHHLCFEVDDLEQMLADLRIKSIRLINDTAQVLPGGRKIAFIHPESANGVLVELYQREA